MQAQVTGHSQRMVKNIHDIPVILEVNLNAILRQKDAVVSLIGNFLPGVPDDNPKEPLSTDGFLGLLGKLVGNIYFTQAAITEGLGSLKGFLDRAKAPPEEPAHPGPEKMASLQVGIDWLIVLIDRQKSINTSLQDTCLMMDSVSDIQKQKTDNPQNTSPDGLLNGYSNKFRDFDNCISITNEYIDIISSFVQSAK